jgi:hypothetical protein
MKAAAELHGARMKLQRAEEHLGQLHTEHDRFISERNPYRMLREEDVEPGYYFWRAKIVEPPPLEKWGSLAGECVHSLRSALDHVAYALVRRNRPTEDYSEFPIFKQRRDWDKRHASKLPGVSAKAITQAKWLQPFRRVDPEIDKLWLIHTLDITDKHRRLSLVSAAVTATGWETFGGTVSDIQPFYGPFEDGGVVARFKLNPDNGQMHVRTNFVFQITFGQAEGRLAGTPVLPFLEGLRTYTGGVVARFDRFF